MEERDPHLSQAYREADHPEPSPALDARVLEAARQAVARPSVRGHARKPARWFAWALPLSTAAVLVLGITLLFEVQRQAPEFMEAPGAMPPSARSEMADAAPAPTPAEPTVASKHLAEAEPAPQAGMTGPAERADESAPADGEAAHRAAAAGAPEPQPFPAQAAARAEAPPAPRALPMATRDAAESAANLAGPPTAPLAAPSPAGVVPPGRESAPALGQAPGQRKAEKVAERPEQMVETIRRLLREGRPDEARKALEKLRRAYPGFTLPEDLQGL